MYTNTREQLRQYALLFLTITESDVAKWSLTASIH